MVEREVLTLLLTRHYYIWRAVVLYLLLTAYCLLLTTCCLLLTTYCYYLLLTAHYSHAGNANSLKKADLQKKLKNLNLSADARQHLEEQLEELEGRMSAGGTNLTTY